jgi:acetyltransferase-like isoleucine patch superfamily enzyme
MTIIDGVLRRMLGGTVRRLVAEEMNRYTYGEDPNPLYRYRVHGKLDRLHIHPTAIVNSALFNVSGGEIRVGEYAFFGHEVAVLTGSHDITKFGRERQTGILRGGRDIVIGDGVWLASHTLVLAPCVIGEHAVVAAGSLVREDVPPYAVVAGRPAKIIKMLTPDVAATGSATPATEGVAPEIGRAAGEV